MPDLLCEDRCLESSLEWGLTGGLTAFTVLNALSPCRQQIMSVETFYAEDPDARRCERQVAHCPDPNALALASVAALLDMPRYSTRLKTPLSLAWIVVPMMDRFSSLGTGTGNF